MNDQDYYYYYNNDKETRSTIISDVINLGLNQPTRTLHVPKLTDSKYDTVISLAITGNLLRHFISRSRNEDATTSTSISTSTSTTAFNGNKLVFVILNRYKRLNILTPKSTESIFASTSISVDSVNLEMSLVTTSTYSMYKDYTMADSKYDNQTTYLPFNKGKFSTSEKGPVRDKNETTSSKDLPLVDLLRESIQDVTKPGYGLVLNLKRNRSTTSINLNSSLFNIRNGTDEYDEIFADDYIYDYNTADTSVDLNEILPVSLVYGFTLAIGVIGNLLVIAAVARDRRLRSITNLFLTSLAAADLALLCFCVPVKCVAFFSFSWAFGFFLCKSVHYVQIVAMVCSVMTLTVMSIERNIAILFPLRSKRICTRGRARIMVVLLWVGSVLLALPILAGQKHTMVGYKLKAYWCIKEWDKPMYGILFESYMLVLLFLVPVCVMVVSYTTICLELSRGMKFRRQATSALSTVACRGYTTHESRQDNCSSRVSCKGSCAARMLHNSHQEKMDQEKMKVIRMLIVVVVLFAICWGPILINNLLVALDVLNKLHIGHLKPLRQTIFLLSYLNSSLNPLVYGFMSRHFRRGFRAAICACCSSNARRDSDNRARRTKNKNCYYASSEGGTSIVRAGTIRLSPANQQAAVVAENELNESPVVGRKYGRKIWTSTDITALDLHM